MKLTEAFELTLANRPSWSTGSGATTAQINTKHVIDILGADFDCTTATSATFVKLQRELQKKASTRGKPFSKSTVNRITSAFHTILQELHYAGHLPHVPSFKRLKEDQGRLTFYTKEQIEQLTEKAYQLNDADMAIAIQVTYKTGCREGELLSLLVGDVDFENRELTFRDTKNGSDHTLPMNEDLYHLLHSVCEGRRPETYIFDSDKDSFYRRFKKVRDACGISHEYVFHTIRHTTGTHLAEAGVPVRTIMGVLNHKNINTTLRYAHATDKAKAHALDLL